MARCGESLSRAACAVVGSFGTRNLGIPEELKTGDSPTSLFDQRGRASTLKNQDYIRFVISLMCGHLCDKDKLVHIHIRTLTRSHILFLYGDGHQGWTNYQSCVLKWILPSPRRISMILQMFSSTRIRSQLSPS